MPQAAPAILRWNIPMRAVVFALSASSIWCLLGEFYGLCSMRQFTVAILIPATAILIALAIADRVKGEGILWRGVVIGAIAGFFAACSYDVFRIPFVIAAAHDAGPDWLRQPLFKVFPRFGAMILGEPFDATTPDAQFSLAAHVIGWIYHFSNGITFGVMYVALIGNVTRRGWLWAVAFATVVELMMLITPYTTFFGIHSGASFIIATLTAHAIFGTTLGLITKRLADVWQSPVPAIK
jgi:Family of unknown function (DUF6789)